MAILDHHFVAILISLCLLFFIFPSNNSPPKTMKNVFDFICKALFVPEIFQFLYFYLSLFFSLLAMALKDG